MGCPSRMWHEATSPGCHRCCSVIAAGKCCARHDVLTDTCRPFRDHAERESAGLAARGRGDAPDRRAGRRRRPHDWPRRAPPRLRAASNSPARVPEPGLGDQGWPDRWRSRCGHRNRRRIRYRADDSDARHSTRHRPPVARDLVEGRGHGPVRRGRAARGGLEERRSDAEAGRDSVASSLTTGLRALREGVDRRGARGAGHLLRAGAQGRPGLRPGATRAVAGAYRRRRSPTGAERHLEMPPPAEPSRARPGSWRPFRRFT